MKNIRNDIEIDVNKIWQDDNNPNRPSSVTVKLYRVSEKGHQWDNGTIVPCTCTENGVKEYTCSLCEATDTHAINAAGHKRGTPHQENYQAPTCTELGGYDTVVRCMVCNAIISTEHTELPSPGHTWENQEVPASNPDHYCYDTVDVCTVCGTVNEATRVQHNHDWGDWETTAPAAINRAGQERRVCRYEPSHTETNEIPPLPATVNIYIRCTGDGSGHQSYTPTYIAERHKDGVGDMTIQWDWNGDTGDVQSIAVEGLSGGASYNTYTTPDGKEYNVQNGQEKGKRQTLTISDITTNQTIYITIRNWNYAGTNNDLIYEPTFAGNYAVPTLNTASPASTRRFAGKSLQKASSTPKLGGEKSEAAIPAVLSGISNLKSKGEAACEDKYWEEVPGSGLRDRSTGNSVESLTKTYAEFIEGQWVLNSSDGIIANGTYTVTENNANFEKYTRVTSVTVDGGNPNTFTQGNGETDPSADITMSGYQGTIAITNAYTRLLDLKIIKVDVNGMTKLLEGARFELRKVDPDKATLSYLDDAATLPTTTREDHKTGSNGEALFENLAAGYYEIKEADMPAGYVQTGDGVFYIKVEDGEVSHVVRTVTVDDDDVSHVTWSPGSDDAMFIFTASSGDTPAEAKVGNEPGAALPSTGGPGTVMYYLLGIMLTGLAGAGLMMRKRRKML